LGHDRWEHDIARKIGHFYRLAQRGKRRIDAGSSRFEPDPVKALAAIRGAHDAKAGGHIMKKFCFIIIALVCHVGAVNAGTGFLPKINKCFDLLQLEVRYDPQREVFIVRNDQVELLNNYFQVSGWLRGFFTARNAYTGGDTAKETTEKEWMPWIYSYCRSHPTNNLLDAAVELSNTLSSTPQKEKE
jgi:hypothetical protein